MEAGSPGRRLVQDDDWCGARASAPNAQGGIWRLRRRMLWWIASEIIGARRLEAPAIRILLACPDDTRDPVDLMRCEFTRGVCGVERDQLDHLIVAPGERLCHHFAGARAHDDTVAAAHRGARLNDD